MKWTPVLVAAMLAAEAGILSCTPGARTCRGSNDCLDGSSCQQGYCVSALAPTDCPSTCDPGTSCTTPANGCQPAVVSISSPAAEAVFGVGASVPVVAHITDADGNPWATGVPVSVEGGATRTLPAPDHDGNAQGAIQLPATEGSWNLTVGWPGASASVAITTKSCSRACNAWEECQPVTSTCQDLKLDLRWNTPSTSPSKCGVNKSVPLDVSVSRADGGPFAAPLPLSVNGALRDALSFDGNSWKGSFVSGDGGLYAVVVGWDAGPSSSRAIEVDNTPPSLSVFPHLGSTGYFQKDDTAALVTLVTSEELSNAGLTLGGAAMAQSTACPPTNDAGACFSVDLSGASLAGLDGGVAVVLSGTDLYGNSAATTATVPVTRVRWVTELNTPQVQSLAVGSDGVLYVGGTGNSANTTLYALNPLTGQVTNSKNPGAVESLAVAQSGPAGADVLYLTYNDNGGTRGNLHAFPASTLDNLALKPPCQGPDTTSETHSALALYRGGADTIAVASMNSDPSGSDKRSTFCLYRATGLALVPLPADAGTPNQFDVKPPTSSGDPPPTPTNLVIRGLTASLLHYDSTTGTAWQPLTLSPSGDTPTVGAPRQVGAMDSSTVAVGQSLFEGGELLGAGGNTSSRRVFNVAGSGVDGGNLDGTTTNKGVPAIASATEGYVGTSNSLLRFNPSSLVTTGTAVYSGQGLYTSPVLGTPAASATKSLGYAVTQTGTLVVFTHSTSTSTLEWTASTGLTGVYPHPTFDKNRKTPDTNTGLLFVGAKGKVMAIVVDSPSLLNTPGSWPKFQRTQGNAGNDDTSNFPTNWP